MFNRILEWASNKLASPEQRALKQAFESQDWQKFLEVSDKLLEKNPKDRDALANAALAHVNLMQWEKALEKINVAIQLKGDMGYYHFIRGLAHNGLNNLPEAIEDCTKAIELGQTHQGTYLIRTLAWTQQHEYDLALKDIDHVIKHCPTFLTAKVHKAFTLHAMYRDGEALDLCNEVIGSLSGKDYVFALAIRSYAYSRLGKLDLAIADMEEALSLGDAKGCIYLDLAHLSVMKKDLDKAQEYIDIAIPAHKREESLRCVQQAKVQLLKGDIEKAVQSAHEAVSKCSHDASIRAIYGLTLVRAGRNDEASRELNTAADADPYCMDARWFRAELYEKMGNEEDAARDKKVASDSGYIPYL
ncbi:MAG TPA: tetratricopeptide repeat protein [Candidatus Melainabacteria bacterium]|nr:tetratricopeptide repeat protein [Candidatus Melainabacteria bacterium]HIN66777.1 tetratricopeptide repeat protein [Candidatus Obscuribacterales bacterium]